MTRIAAIYIPKGGVGKTTLTSHLASGLAEAGRRVLAVDVDPHQAQLVLAFGDLERRPSTFDFFLGRRPLAELKQTPARFPTLDIITGTPQSSGELSNHLSKGKNPYWITTLERQLKPILPLYDYVLFDCGPAITDVMQCVLHASTEQWLPYKIDWKTMDSYMLLLEEVLGPMGKNPDTFITHVIPNFFSLGVERKPKENGEAGLPWFNRAKSNEALAILEELKRTFGGRLTPPVRSVEAKLLEADSAGQTLWELAPAAPITDDLASVVTAILEKEEA